MTGRLALNIGTVETLAEVLACVDAAEACGYEAVLIGEGIGYILKGSLGRSRPFVSNDAIPHDFDLGRGFNWRYLYHRYRQPSRH